MTSPLPIPPNLVPASIEAQAADGYRCWTTDLLSGRKLCHDLPIALDSYRHGQVNAPGDSSGTISLNVAENPQLTCAERRTVLWVEHRGRVVWGGIIWDAEPDIASGTLRIAAQTWSSYFQRSLIRDTLVYRNSTGGYDQHQVFRELVAYAQAKSSANIGVVVDTHNSAVLVTQIYGPGAGDGARPDKPVLEALRELAESDPGFEYTDDWSDDGTTDNPGKRIRLGYPRLGVQDGTDLLFEHPGSIQTYTWVKDGGDSPNVLLAIGAGDGPNQLVETATNTEELAVGYPRLEASTGGDYREVVRRATLAAHARADLTALTGGKLAPVFTIAGPDGPQPGDLGAGDVIRCRLTSDFHRAKPDGSPGYDGYFRTTGITVVPLRADQDGRMDIATVPAGLA